LLILRWVTYVLKKVTRSAKNSWFDTRHVLIDEWIGIVSGLGRRLGLGEVGDLLLNVFVGSD
jgi:hypothetical protein